MTENNKFKKGNTEWKKRDQLSANKKIKIAMNNPKTKTKLSERSKSSWSNPEIRKKYLKSFKNRPNPTAESNIKRSLALMGRPSPTKGMKFSKEINKLKGRFGKDNAMSRPEIKLKQKIACRTYGKQWKGGKSFEPYTIEFDKDLKIKIKNRDLNCCKKCYNRDKQLQIHHIDYNKQNNIEKNLITLCSSCHSKTNWNRNYHESYFKLKNFMEENNIMFYKK